MQIDRELIIRSAFANKGQQLQPRNAEGEVRTKSKNSAPRRAEPPRAAMAAPRALAPAAPRGPAALPRAAPAAAVVTMQSWPPPRSPPKVQAMV
jgi:hypothetical protein